MRLICITFVLLGILKTSIADNGFGSAFAWIESLDEAMNEAKEREAPLMLIIHKSWCGACKALKPKFASSEPLQQFSRHFVMVNLIDDQEPAGDEYRPDGGYIPRILFLNPQGEVMTDIYNEMGSMQHKYFYSGTEDILRSMKKALTAVRENPSVTRNEEL